MSLVKDYELYVMLFKILIFDWSKFLMMHYFLKQWFEYNWNKYFLIESSVSFQYLFESWESFSLALHITWSVIMELTVSLLSGLMLFSFLQGLYVISVRVYVAWQEFHLLIMIFWHYIHVMPNAHTHAFQLIENKFCSICKNYDILFCLTDHITHGCYFMIALTDHLMNLVR
jgi:hypothetical protein